MTQKNRKIENKSFFMRKEDVKHGWIIMDAAGKTLGRFAAEVARLLIGKHKATYTPSTDDGDGVIVINAEKIRVTGNKEAQKNYYHHTGYAGGLRETSYRTMMERKPEYIIEHAVKGMVPHSRLGRQQLKRLRVFKGTEHQMAAQQPIQANI